MTALYIALIKHASVAESPITPITHRLDQCGTCLARIDQNITSKSLIRSVHKYFAGVDTKDMKIRTKY